jgi:hypothetical protein
MSKRSLTAGFAAVLLLVLSALYFAYTIFLARHQSLNNDEIFTMWMVRDVPSITGALKLGADTAPPTYYFLQRGVCHLLGFTPFALRLPALLSFFVFLASMFMLLRRYVGVEIAAVCAALPLFSSALSTATNGRPYAIVLACFGVICVLWCNDERVRPALWRSCTIALLLAFAICMHFYAVLLVPLLGCMELIWALENRVIRWRNWIAMLAGGGSLVLSLPVIIPIDRAVRLTSTAGSFYAKPNPARLLEFIHNIALSPSLELIFVVLLGVGITIQGVRIVREKRGQMPSAVDSKVYLDHLGTVGFAAFVFPFVSYVFARLVTNVLNERYLFAVIVGVSVGIALSLRRLRWGPGPVLLVMVVMIAVFVKNANYDRKAGIVWAASQERLMASAPGNDPIILPDGPDYFKSMESSSPAIRARGMYVLPPPGMHNPNREPERLAVAWKKLKPAMNVETNDEFLAEHQHFYILCRCNRYEIITSWALNTWHGRVLHFDPGDWTLFEVSR